MLGRHDDGGLVIGVVFGEITDGFENLRRLVRTKDIVPSPDLSWLDTYKRLFHRPVTDLIIHWLCLKGISRDNAEIVSTSFEGREEIYCSTVTFCFGSQFVIDLCLPVFSFSFAFTMVPLARTTSKLMTLFAAQPY